MSERDGGSCSDGRDGGGADGRRWDGDGGVKHGAVHILFLNSDGTVKAHQKISHLVGGLGGLTPPLRDGNLFGTVLADIGDLQSVEGDLSTFSGHVMVLKQLLRQADDGVLVLLDEVAVEAPVLLHGDCARQACERGRGCWSAVISTITAR